MGFQCRSFQFFVCTSPCSPYLLSYGRVKEKKHNDDILHPCLYYTSNPPQLTPHCLIRKHVYNPDHIDFYVVKYSKFIYINWSELFSLYRWLCQLNAFGEFELKCLKEIRISNIKQNRALIQQVVTFIALIFHIYYHYCIETQLILIDYTFGNIIVLQFIYSKILKIKPVNN